VESWKWEQVGTPCSYKALFEFVGLPSVIVGWSRRCYQGLSRSDSLDMLAPRRSSLLSLQCRLVLPS
jgi:hypothetical protein